MSATDRLLAHVEQFAAGWTGGDLPAEPALRTAIVTCMDARLDPVAVLGLSSGDAHVIRNAGAAVTSDVRRSLTVSQRLLGTREIIVIQHTACGMRAFSEPEFRAQLQEETGAAPDWSVEIFTEPERDVRQALNRIRLDPFIPHRDSVRGFVFDVATGTLAEVK